MTKRKRDDRGAAMVEFAIILPLLLMLLVGIIEFGRAYNIQISIQAAAREGARELALAQARNRRRARVQRRSSVGRPLIRSTQTPCPATGDGQAKVIVTETSRSTSPFVPLGIDKTLTATGVMRCGL